MKITIPQPCAEEWQNMRPTEKGAYCKLCQKEVIDFSQKTDFEIYQLFQNHQKEKVCGRFRENQLTRELGFIPENKWLKWQRVILILPWLWGAKSLYAQNNAESKPKPNNKQTISLLNQKSKTQIKKIKGKILDFNSHQPIENVFIYTPNEKFPNSYTESDTLGSFELKINSKESNIGFSRLGYNTYEVPLDVFTNQNLDQVFTIYLQENVIALDSMTVEGFHIEYKSCTVGAIAIIKKRKHLFFGRIWDFIKKPFVRKKEDE